MGNGASVDSIIDVEDALAKAGNGPLDENAVRKENRCFHQVVHINREVPTRLIEDLRPKLLFIRYHSRAYTLALDVIRKLIV
jgi:hypothetical protein